MKVTVYEAESGEQTAFLRLANQNEVVFTREPMNATTAAQHADAEAISISSRYAAPHDVLALMPSLQLISTRSTGFDHIDLDYCRSHGITVCNVPGYGDVTVAEYTFALLLAVSRRIPEAAERTRKGDFSQEGLTGFDLRGKTLGVIGTGRIGRRVIEIAKGFGMIVVAYDTQRDEPLARSLGFRYCDLPDLLSQSDVVTLHVPAVAGTHNLISDREFDQMKRGVVLINTARGSVVDVPALVRALADGRVAAAGLDVLTAEPLMRDDTEIFRKGRQHTDAELRALLGDHVLLRLPNVIVTAHIAFNTDDAVYRLLDTAVSNIANFARGRPENVIIDPHRLQHASSRSGA